MRSNLEPLIDKLFEEDELFVQDFEDVGLNRVLFIRKMGIYVEVSNKLCVTNNEKTPLHCPTRCPTSVPYTVTLIQYIQRIVINN